MRRMTVENPTPATRTRKRGKAMAKKKKKKARNPKRASSRRRNPKRARAKRRNPTRRRAKRRNPTRRRASRRRNPARRASSRRTTRRNPSRRRRRRTKSNPGWDNLASAGWALLAGLGAGIASAWISDGPLGNARPLVANLAIAGEVAAAVYWIDNPVILGGVVVGIGLAPVASLFLQFFGPQMGMGGGAGNGNGYAMQGGPPQGGYAVTMGKAHQAKVRKLRGMDKQMRALHKGGTMQALHKGMGALHKGTAMQALHRGGTMQALHKGRTMQGYPGSPMPGQRPHPYLMSGR
jgi:hypothetical protein